MGQVRTSTPWSFLLLQTGQEYNFLCPPQNEKFLATLSYQIPKPNWWYGLNKNKDSTIRTKQSSYTRLKFSSLLRGLHLQEPSPHSYRADAPLAMAAVGSFPPSPLTAGGTGRLNPPGWPDPASHAPRNQGLRRQVRGRTRPWPSTQVLDSHVCQRVPDTQPGPGTEPKINVYGIATAMLIEGSGISSYLVPSAETWIAPWFIPTVCAWPVKRLLHLIQS